MRQRNMTETFWTWFQGHGDDVCVFISMCAATLQSDPQISPVVLHAVIQAGLIAGVAHKVFFPNVPVSLPANPTGVSK
jgi:hypothetical protein